MGSCSAPPTGIARDLPNPDSGVDFRALAAASFGRYMVPPDLTVRQQPFTQGYEPQTELCIASAYHCGHELQDRNRAASLHAQRAGRRGTALGARARARAFRHGAWVYDDRYHHNRYYPAVGYAVTTLPPGNIVVSVPRRQFLVPFRRLVPARRAALCGRAPANRGDRAGAAAGLLGRLLRRRAVLLRERHYYVQQPSGYEVVAPPKCPRIRSSDGRGTGSSAVLQAPAPGDWYYCDSSKAYYPYVQQCPEGWSTVPASRPARRAAPTISQEDSSSRAPARERPHVRCAIGAPVSRVITDSMGPLTAKQACPAASP